MEIPVSYKDIEINERKFRLNKMNARDSSYMLFKMLKIITPIFKSLKTEDLDKLKNMELGDLNITEIAESLFTLEEKEFRYIQDNLLKAVSESLPSGMQPILGDNLVFSVLNIEFDVELVLNLTIQNLIFNLSGFFQGSWLKKLTNK